MGVLSLFSNKNKANDDELSKASSKTSKSSSTRSSISKSSKAKQRKQTTTKPKRSTNEAIIDEYLAALNRHCPIEEMLTFFASEEVIIAPEDGPSVNALQFAHILKDVYLSFEDVTFDGSSCKEIRPGVVMLEDNVTKGTHTGAPYGFAHYPPVPAQNKFVQLDPERVYFEMDKNGKIEKMQVVALGTNTGAPGLYLLAGGTL